MNSVTSEESQYYTLCRRELKRAGIEDTRFTHADYARWYERKIPRENIAHQARQELEAAS